jgi:hypothetical protein
VNVALSREQTGRRPWWRRPWFLALTTIVAAIALLGERCAGGDPVTRADDEPAQVEASRDETASGDESTEGNAEATTESTAAPAEADRTGDDPNPGATYAERPDIQDQDQERSVGGDPARFSGYTAWTDSVEFRPDVPGAGQAGYLAVSFRVLNRDETSQPFEAMNWKLTAPDGTVLSPLFASRPDLIEGHLPANAELSGSLFYEVGDRRGDFYVVFDPDRTDTGRGVWGVTL